MASYSKMVFTQACQREFEVCGLHSRRFFWLAGGSDWAGGCFWSSPICSDFPWSDLQKQRGEGRTWAYFLQFTAVKDTLKGFRDIFPLVFFLSAVNSGHACIWRLSKGKPEKLSSLKKQQRLHFDVLGASPPASPPGESIVPALLKQHKPKNCSVS